MVRGIGGLYIRGGNEKSISQHSIVLDLDETLLHTFERLEDVQEIGIFSDPDYIELRKDVYIIDIYTEDRDTVKYRMWGVMRPKLREFLNFCFRYFRNVTIWTAGQRRYGNAIVSKIFTSRSPELVFTRDECPKSLSGGCINKPLTYIIDKKDDMSLHHTFILDDRLENFQPNPDNGILIPPFYPERDELLNIKDSAFDDLMKWFMKPEVIKSEDIRLLNKKNIFSNFK